MIKDSNKKDLNSKLTDVNQDEITKKVLNHENITVEDKTLKEQETKPRKKMNKTILYMVLILVITGIVLYFSLKDHFFDVIEIMKDIDPLNLTYAILLFVAGFSIDCLILYLFARRFKKKYYYHQAYANGLIGTFYNAVTPSQTGGQIMQAYTFKKQGISISNATSCLVMNFIVYQLVLVLFGIFAIVMKFTNIFGIAGIEINVNGVTLGIPMWLLTILGFFLEFTVIGLTLLMSLSKKFHNFILNRGINLLAKLYIVKKPDEVRRKLSVSVESFKIELRNLFSNPIFLIIISFLHIVSFILKFMIPYFLGIAVLGNTGEASTFIYSMMDVICYTSFHKMVAELIPIPGGAGVSEYFYNVLFSGCYDKAVLESMNVEPTVLLNASQIIWRTITFHIPLIVSGFVAAFYRTKSKGEEFVQASNTTYLDLQMQTISERKATFETMYSTKMLSRNEYAIKNEKFKKTNFMHKKKDKKD